MPSVGSHLRELRERHGVSVEEIARSTRVLHQYLESLEGDDYGSLPAPVFTKGFIRAYCQVLGEPPEGALARWAARAGGEGEVGTSPPPAPRARAPEPSAEGRGRGAVLVSFVLLVVLGLALFVTTLALQSGRSVPPERPVAAPAVEPRPGAVPAPASPPPGEAAPTAAVAPALPAVGAPPTAAPVPPVAAGVAAPYRLVARTTEATWIRVRTEDGRSSEETVPPGEVREWVSNRPFVLTIGNAGGVAFELNGRPLPPFGKSGEVITRLVLPSDAQ